MARKKKSSAKTATKKSPMPKKIFAQASPRSVGGVSMFDALGAITADTVGGFQSDRNTIDEAANRLLEAGFEVLQVTAYTINIAGTRNTFEKAFGTRLVTEERPVIKGGALEDTATFVECPDTALPGLIGTQGTTFEDVLEGVAIEEPRYFMGPSMFPPLKEYWHLDVPAGVSVGLNADKAHRSGITGKGVKVAMVDSGHYKHPFFTSRGYRVAPVVLGPAASNPTHDESGHGTGESANVFSVAPDVDLLPVKINFVNSKGAFDAAVNLSPDIITCSWGSSRKFSISAADQLLATSVADAWASGIVVIFSAGNGHWGFPGQHPDVISAGGVFMNSSESLRASDYASGFISNIYAGRRVPDVCGLVGMKPKAIYIMLPVEPGDAIDSTPWNQPHGLQGGTHPQGDETSQKDGWAAFSGTSAAAPQLAGLAALIKQACGKLKPSQVRDVMMKTARDVTQGNCNTSSSGASAAPGPDTATGHGLVDCQKAVLLAKLRCVGPRRGRSRGGPIVDRGRRGEPIRSGPVVRGEPIRSGPEPIRREPGPRGPAPRGLGSSLEQASLEEASLEEQSGLTEEELQTLEQMVVDSELGLEDLD